MNNKTTAIYFAKRKRATGSNFRTNGNEVYSYSTMIAQRVNGVILVDARDYSATTQRHKLHLFRALKNWFEVPNINPTRAEHHNANITHFCRLSAEAQQKAERARTERSKTIWQERARQEAETAVQYCRAFNLI